MELNQNWTSSKARRLLVQSKNGLLTCCNWNWYASCDLKLWSSGDFFVITVPPILFWTIWHGMQNNLRYTPSAVTFCSFWIILFAAFKTRRAAEAEYLRTGRISSPAGTKKARSRRQGEGQGYKMGKLWPPHLLLPEMSSLKCFVISWSRKPAWVRKFFLTRVRIELELSGKITDFSFV